MPTKVNTIPYTSHELNQLFRYDPETGKLFWKVSTSNRIKVGDEAGSKTTLGYIMIRLDKKYILAHRIIMKMCSKDYNESLYVDHCDGNPLNNRYSNLRLTTIDENLKNKKRYKNNKSGEMGIYHHRNRWEVGCRIDGKQIYGGRYTSIEEAIKARDKLHEKHGFHPNHGRKQFSVQ